MTKLLTPKMLAEALRSGDWIRHKDGLSTDTVSKHNCCLGVGMRLVHDGLIPDAAVQNSAQYERSWAANYPSPEWQDEHAPWLGQGPNKAWPVREILAATNDMVAADIWETFTTPFLNELAINEDGTLAKEQTMKVNRVLGVGNGGVAVNVWKVET